MGHWDWVEGSYNMFPSDFNSGSGAAYGEKDKVITLHVHSNYVDYLRFKKD